MRASEEELQRSYYERTATQYDAAHLHGEPEHTMALAFMTGAARELGVESVLDVGSGTGRTLRYLAAHAPHLRYQGIEPIEALRKVGHQQGIPEQQLVDGDATDLKLDAGAFDLVCAFGVLHHVRHHERVVAEMLRVAKVAIFVSDANRYGQGSLAMRGAKQVLGALRLWPVANLLKTRGKGYIVTEGDGLSYSYSVFDDYPAIRQRCSRVHVLNTTAAGINPYRTAGHVALLGVK